MNKPKATLDINSRTLRHGARAIRIGSDAWRLWLEQETPFKVVCNAGTFLARCEPHKRGGPYWRAYKRISGRLRRAYLGKSSELDVNVFAAAASAIFAPTPAHRTAAPKEVLTAQYAVPDSDAIDDLFVAGNNGALKTSLDAVPKAHIQASPRLSLASLINAMQHGNWRDVEDTLITVAMTPNHAQRDMPAQLLLEAFSELSQGHVDICAQRIRQAQQTGQVQGWLLDTCVESLTAATRWLQGSMDESLRFFAKQRVDPEAIDYTDLTLLALSHQARIYHVQGQLHAAATRYQRVIDIRAPHGHPAIFMALHGLGRLQFERGQYTQAIQTTERLRAHASAVDAYDFVLTAHVLRARLHDAQGEHTLAQRELTHASEQSSRRRPARLTELALSLAQAEHSLVIGDAIATRSWLRDLEHVAEEHLLTLLLHARWLDARVDSLDGDFSLALRKLTALDAQLASSGQDNLRVGVVACQAVSLHRMNQTPEALRLLATIIGQAADEGQLRMMIDTGPAITFLLRQLRPTTGRRAAQQIRFIERVCGELGVEHTEQLTSRELDAVRHLSAGLANEQIAAAMSVSVATAKRHLTHVYLKLNAKSRTQAIAAARAIGIIF
jgi:ATP/maltotriose-dependent transcriptional regulator MalT